MEGDCEQTCRMHSYDIDSISVHDMRYAIRYFA
jgi:hypothetical protein